MCEGRPTGHFTRAEATQENIMVAATARTLSAPQVAVPATA
jgi:hypothetical protein